MKTWKENCVCLGDTAITVLGNLNNNLGVIHELLGTVIPSKQYSSVPTNSAPITVAADITIAAGEKLFIQNLDTDALFVRRGTGCTTAAFNYVLQAGGVQDDGTGGALMIDDFIGVVSFAGTTPRYNAWKP